MSINIVACLVLIGLGGTSIKLRALYIVLESVLALLAVWLIGRRLPKISK